MKRLICELCESTDIVKDGGVFVCQVCGCKYSIEEAKRIMEDQTEKQAAKQTEGDQGHFGETIKQGKYGEEQGKENMDTWVCPECETINSAEECILCGYLRTGQNWDIKKKSLKLVVVIGLAAGLLIAVLLLSILHDHDWMAATCTAPKTCTICGEMSGSALGHSWKAATCTAPKTCTICGEMSGSALGHSWKAATCAAPKTCTICGEMSGSALGHSWKAATCTAPKTCTICGKMSGSALGHSWKAATYDTPKTCSVCNKKDGNVKGYIGDVSGSFTGDRFYRSGRWTSYYTLSKKIENCRKFTLNHNITNISKGNPYGNFEIFVRTGTKEWEWKSLGIVKIEEEYVEIPVEVEPGISFDAIAVVCNASYYSYSNNLTISDVYVY